LTLTTQDLCDDFAGLAAGARYETLPQGAVDAARKSILDTLGVILAASGMEPAGRSVAAYALEMQGRPEATVLGMGERAPAAMAAFANGAMAHCLDFDDRTPWGAHCSSSLVPAVLALAEKHGGVSGRRLITAVAIGQDLFARLRYHVEWEQDWNISTVMGVFSATAGAAHVLGLSREQAGHALGLAGMQPGGTMGLIYGTGSDARGLYAGFTAKSAVVAAELAARGITGVDRLFEGEAGILKTYFRKGYDRDGMRDHLGTDYWGAKTLYKPWPIVGVAHTYIHTTMQLMQRHGLRAEDIGQINIHVGDYHQRMCSPLDQRRAPRTAVDAKFSLPYCIAIVAVRGDLAIGDFAPQALSDPAVLAMAQRVVPIEDNTRNWTTAPPDARIEVVTTAGHTHELAGCDVPGSPKSPMGWDDIARKFRACAAVSARPIGPERILKLQEMVQQLETLDDSAELLRTLG